MEVSKKKARRRKLGRPPIGAAVKRVVIVFRADDAEDKLIQKASKICKLSLSKFVRDTVLKEARAIIYGD